MCGTPVAQVAAERQRIASERETIRFARAVLSRPYMFTMVFLVANFFVFLLMWHSSGMSIQALWLIPEPVLLAYGAKLNSLIKGQPHQWWRLVTPMFIHVGILHLLVNMYSLWIVGPYVEKLYGSAKFVVFWVVTGVAGVLASYLTVVEPNTSLGPLGRFIFKTQDGPSAGASGALFGLVGVLFVFGIKFRHELPEGFKRAFGTGMLPIILINLFIGYVGRGLIDNAAHLGGLLSGAALALVVDYRRPGERASIAITWRVLQIAALALVASSFVKVAQHLRDPLPARQFAQTNQTNSNQQTLDFVAYVEAMHQAQEVFYSTLKDRNPGGVDGAVQALESAPQLDAKADDLRQELKTLLIKAKQITFVGRSSERLPRDIQKEQSKLIMEFASWSKEYNTWLKTTGKSYAGPVQEP
jgi:rhomboid protease GluP